MSLARLITSTPVRSSSSFLLSRPTLPRSYRQSRSLLPLLPRRGCAVIALRPRKSWLHFFWLLPLPPLLHLLTPPPWFLLRPNGALWELLRPPPPPDMPLRLIFAAFPAPPCAAIASPLGPTLLGPRHTVWLTRALGRRRPARPLATVCLLPDMWVDA